MRRIALRDMPISPSQKIGPKVLKILGLGHIHPTGLIMLLLNEVAKSNILRLNVGSYEGLFLLNGPKDGSKLLIIMGGEGGPGGRTRGTIVRSWGRGKLGMNSFVITGHR